MAVKHEIKSQLAKLLATEDLIVEHKESAGPLASMSTTLCPDPFLCGRRQATLSMTCWWVMRLAHALFTPDENWLEKVAIPPQFRQCG